MSFPIFPQFSVVMLQESSKGLYSRMVYTIRLLSLFDLWKDVDFAIIKYITQPNKREGVKVRSKYISRSDTDVQHNNEKVWQKGVIEILRSFC